MMGPPGVPMHGMPMQGMPPGGFGPAGPGTHYEFSSIENLTIDKVGGRARLCGVIALVSGVIGLGFSVLFVVVSALGLFEVSGTFSTLPIIMASTVAPTSIINLVAGFFYVKAGDSLKEVATTQGSDVPHMMDSLRRFQRAFQLESIVTGLAMALGIVGTILTRVLS